MILQRILRYPVTVSNDELFEFSEACDVLLTIPRKYEFIKLY